MKDHGYIASGEMSDYLDQKAAARRKQDALALRASEDRDVVALCFEATAPPPIELPTWNSKEWYVLWEQAKLDLMDDLEHSKLDLPQSGPEIDRLLHEYMRRILATGHRVL